MIVKNASDISEYESVLPLDQPHAANKNLEPLVVLNDDNFIGNVGSVDIVAQFYDLSL